MKKHTGKWNEKPQSNAEKRKLESKFYKTTESCNYFRAANYESLRFEVH